MKNILISLCALGFAATAGAATQSTTFTVSATVVSSCAISASNLGFGNYDPLAVSATTGTTSVNVQCSLLAPFNILLNSGVQGGGTVTTRKMKIAGVGTDTLNYELTRDVGHALNWGETIGTDTLSGLGTGLSVASTIYGRIAAGQNKPIGSYSDTITVTVNY